jgi:hypothetical protein
MENKETPMAAEAVPVASPSVISAPMVVNAPLANAQAPVRASSSVFDVTVKSVNATWSIVKIALVIGTAVWLLSLKNSNSAPADSQLGMEKFITLASPLETSKQEFSIGNYKLPQIAVLAALPEAERMANPSMTAAQLQRAKWMDRTWKDVGLRNEENRALPSAGQSDVAKQFVAGILNDVLDKKTQKETGTKSISELSGINVVVGDEVIPSLASGLLPVFTDAETAAWKTELAREKIVLNELDMRRAKFFLVKFGPGSMPAKAPSDMEIRTAEKLESDVRNGWAMTRPTTAPLSDNERLEAACQALNFVANPALIPAALIDKKTS